MTGEDDDVTEILGTFTDPELSRVIAREAGAMLLALRESYGLVEPGDKERRERLRKEGDLLAHELIAAAFAEHRPNDALLSEEGKDDDRRLTAERVWIVDPLDGTREFERFGGRLAQHMKRKPLRAATTDAGHGGEGFDQAADGFWIGSVGHRICPKV